MTTTTAPATCDTIGCTNPAEIGIRVLARGNLKARDALMCGDDATRVYNLFDYNRRGGKVELFDLYDD